MTERIPLNGEWQFSEAGSDVWKPGTVPGCVQLDLMRLGEVKDPFYGLNEIEMYALEEKEWVYQKAFALDDSILDNSQINLIFEGIDTLADVYLNGTYLGRAENMFIPYAFDVTDIVEEGDNLVEVRFDSPIRTIRTLESTSPVSLKSSCESARVYARKAQYSYGWDWGPRIAQVGLWRPVYLELIQEAKISDPFFYTEKLEGDVAVVRVKADVELLTEGDVEAEIVVCFEDQECVALVVPVQNIKGQWGIDVAFTIAEPRLWYPNGLGAQPLYDIQITVQDDDQVLDDVHFRAGIRTVRLIQEADREGQSFIFAVNGIRVFCKGADWIPADSLLPRLTRHDYYAYIQLAKDANMNMLRIWGGGIYEDPAFYDACDEYGIMVWQDFMYACAQYPDEFDWFQDLAEEEAISVVRALRNHPALVLWCGNNENNWGFDEWWHNGAPKYLGNTVYREILPNVCAEDDPSRPYWVSSPYGGEHPNGMGEGDRHAWGVWSNWQDYGGYLNDTGRFLSEFGFQAMPTWKTVLSYSAPEDRTILSPVTRSHNKMTEGTERLTRFMVGRLGFPKDFRSFCELTQFNQAEAIKTGVEHWRVRKFNTSGALYWQLNDCWPVASWACLDYYKRKKGLWYYTKKFFSPIWPVLKREERGVAIYAVNDTLGEVQGRLRATIYKLDGSPCVEKVREVTIPANEVTKLGLLSLDEMQIGYSPRVVPVDGNSTTNPRELNGELLDTVVYVELTLGAESYVNYFVFDRFRNLALHAPQIDVQIEGQRIILKAAKPAFGVFVETEEDVDLSDNCLNLEPGVACVLECSGAPGKVEVRSLVDMVAAI